MRNDSNTKVSVRNYGPIAEAKDVELCPLTVFVGPSNTGKSYLAILVYSLFKSFESMRFARPVRLASAFYGAKSKKEEKGERVSLAATKFGSKYVDDIVKILQNGNSFDGIRFSGLSAESKDSINQRMAEIVNRNFHREISRCMGVPMEDRNLIKDQFEFEFSNDKASFAFGLEHPPNMDIKELKPTKRYTKWHKRFLMPKHEDYHLDDVYNEIIAEEFLEGILEDFFDTDSKKESFYLPAARTGIMQSHRAIAGALVRRAALAGLEPLSVPTLSGIVSDFLNEVIQIDITRIPGGDDMAKIADEMEKNILHGSIESENPESTPYPQFTYKQNGFEVPLLRSSSMVSELAPAVLFIRHRVGRGDLLIIEEPEAHLHPEAQRKVAKMIVRLVRAGVKVMTTTHSDYFLEQIGNYVRLSELSKDKRKSIAVTQGLFLNENEVGAYGFKGRSKGTIVKRLRFDVENGLIPEDHAKVSSDLYNETVEILDKMEDKQ